MSTRPESTPDPVDPRCGDPVVEENVAFLRERSRVGQAKYGTLLTREDLTPDQWMDHVMEELGDALNYMRRLKHQEAGLSRPLAVLLKIWAGWIASGQLRFSPDDLQTANELIEAAGVEPLPAEFIADVEKYWPIGPAGDGGEPQS